MQPLTIPYSPFVLVWLSFSLQIRCTFCAFPFVTRAKQERIQKDKDYHGASYIREFDGFVCVNKYGGMTLPEYLTKSFKTLIEKAGLKPIRLHDLRHSCA